MARLPYEGLALLLTEARNEYFLGTGNRYIEVLQQPILPRNVVIAHFHLFHFKLIFTNFTFPNKFNIN
ncbi:MAG: hypothetical protein CVU62_00870 [Deltaproteobacteria bacterium HGW-Deltaproteobacteria-2]|nr:MAG: hypothetical protein CVU62_00870 [Deltaproteobacteria bacterium HGW-Deltaproteobacteria-2]